MDQFFQSRARAGPSRVEQPIPESRSPLPRWQTLPMDAKFPVIPAPKGEVTFVTTKMCQPAYRSSQKKDFDLSDPFNRTMNTEYQALCDPYLKSWFNRPSVLKELRKQNLITENGNVTCSVREFNEYRSYLRRQAVLQNKRNENDHEERRRMQLDQTKVKAELFGVEVKYKRLKAKQKIKEAEEEKQKQLEEKLAQEEARERARKEREERERVEVMRERASKWRSKQEQIKKREEQMISSAHSKLLAVEQEAREKLSKLDCIREQRLHQLEEKRKEEWRKRREHQTRALEKEIERQRKMEAQGRLSRSRIQEEKFHTSVIDQVTSETKREEKEKERRANNEVYAKRIALALEGTAQQTLRHMEPYASLSRLTSMWMVQDILHHRGLIDLSRLSRWQWDRPRNTLLDTPKLSVALDTAIRGMEEASVLGPDQEMLSKLIHLVVRQVREAYSVRALTRLTRPVEGVEVQEADHVPKVLFPEVDDSVETERAVHITMCASIDMDCKVVNPVKFGDDTGGVENYLLPPVDDHFFGGQTRTTEYDAREKESELHDFLNNLAGEDMRGEQLKAVVGMLIRLACNEPVVDVKPYDILFTNWDSYLSSEPTSSWERGGTQRQGNAGLGDQRLNGCFTESESRTGPDGGEIRSQDETDNDVFDLQSDSRADDENFNKKCIDENNNSNEMGAGDVGDVKLSEEKSSRDANSAECRLGTGDDAGQTGEGRRPVYVEDDNQGNLGDQAESQPTETCPKEPATEDYDKDDDFEDDNRESDKVKEFKEKVESEEEESDEPPISASTDKSESGRSEHCHDDDAPDIDRKTDRSDDGTDERSKKTDSSDDGIDETDKRNYSSDDGVDERDKKNYSSDDGVDKRDKKNESSDDGNDETDKQNESSDDGSDKIDKKNNSKNDCTYEIDKKNDSSDDDADDHDPSKVFTDDESKVSEHITSVTSASSIEQSKKKDVTEAGEEESVTSILAVDGDGGEEQRESGSEEMEQNKNKNMGNTSQKISREENIEGSETSSDADESTKEVRHQSVYKEVSAGDDVVTLTGQFLARMQHRSRFEGVGLPLSRVHQFIAATMSRLWARGPADNQHKFGQWIEDPQLSPLAQSLITNIKMRRLPDRLVARLGRAVVSAVLGGIRNQGAYMTEGVIRVMITSFLADVEQERVSVSVLEQVLKTVIADYAEFLNSDADLQVRVFLSETLIQGREKLTSGQLTRRQLLMSIPYFDELPRSDQDNLSTGDWRTLLHQARVAIDLNMVTVEDKQHLREMVVRCGQELLGSDADHNVMGSVARMRTRMTQADFKHSAVVKMSANTVAILLRTIQGTKINSMTLLPGVLNSSQSANSSSLLDWYSVGEGLVILFLDKLARDMGENTLDLQVQGHMASSLAHLLTADYKFSKKEVKGDNLAASLNFMASRLSCTSGQGRDTKKLLSIILRSYMAATLKENEQLTDKIKLEDCQLTDEDLASSLLGLVTQVYVTFVRGVVDRVRQGGLGTGQSDDVMTLYVWRALAALAQEANVLMSELSQEPGESDPAGVVRKSDSFVLEALLYTMIGEKPGSVFSGSSDNKRIDGAELHPTNVFLSAVTQQLINPGYIPVPNFYSPQQQQHKVQVPLAGSSLPLHEDQLRYMATPPEIDRAARREIICVCQDISQAVVSTQAWKHISTQMAAFYTSTVLVLDKFVSKLHNKLSQLRQGLCKKEIQPQNIIPFLVPYKSDLFPTPSLTTDTAVRLIHRILVELCYLHHITTTLTKMAEGMARVGQSPDGVKGQPQEVLASVPTSMLAQFMRVCVLNTLEALTTLFQGQSEKTLEPPGKKPVCPEEKKFVAAAYVIVHNELAEIRDLVETEASSDGLWTPRDVAGTGEDSISSHPVEVLDKVFVCLAGVLESLAQTRDDDSGEGQTADHLATNMINYIMDSVKSRVDAGELPFLRVNDLLLSVPGQPRSRADQTGPANTSDNKTCYRSCKIENPVTVLEADISKTLFRRLINVLSNIDITLKEQIGAAMMVKEEYDQKLHAAAFVGVKLGKAKTDLSDNKIRLSTWGPVNLYIDNQTSSFLHTDRRSISTKVCRDWSAAKLKSNFVDASAKPRTGLPQKLPISSYIENLFSKIMCEDETENSPSADQCNITHEILQACYVVCDSFLDPASTGAVNTPGPNPDPISILLIEMIINDLSRKVEDLEKCRPECFLKKNRNVKDPYLYSRRHTYPDPLGPYFAEIADRGRKLPLSVRLRHQSQSSAISQTEAMLHHSMAVNNSNKEASTPTNKPPIHKRVDKWRKNVRHATATHSLENVNNSWVKRPHTKHQRRPATQERPHKMGRRTRSSIDHSISRIKRTTSSKNTQESSQTAKPAVLTRANTDLQLKKQTGKRTQSTLKNSQDCLTEKKKPTSSTIQNKVSSSSHSGVSSTYHSGVSLTNRRKDSSTNQNKVSSTNQTLTNQSKASSTNQSKSSLTNQSKDSSASQSAASTTTQKIPKKMRRVSRPRTTKQEKLQSAVTYNAETKTFVNTSGLYAGPRTVQIYYHVDDKDMEISMVNTGDDEICVQDIDRQEKEGEGEKPRRVRREKRWENDQFENMDTKSRYGETLVGEMEQTAEISHVEVVLCLLAQEMADHVKIVRWCGRKEQLDTVSASDLVDSLTIIDHVLVEVGQGDEDKVKQLLQGEGLAEKGVSQKTAGAINNLLRSLESGMISEEFIKERISAWTQSDETVFDVDLTSFKQKLTDVLEQMVDRVESRVTQVPALMAGQADNVLSAISSLTQGGCKDDSGNEEFGGVRDQQLDGGDANGANHTSGLDDKCGESIDQAEEDYNQDEEEEDADYGQYEEEEVDYKEDDEEGDAGYSGCEEEGDDEADCSQGDEEEGEANYSEDEVEDDAEEKLEDTVVEGTEERIGEEKGEEREGEKEEVEEDYTAKEDSKSLDLSVEEEDNTAKVNSKTLESSSWCTTTPSVSPLPVTSHTSIHASQAKVKDDDQDNGDLDEKTSSESSVSASSSKSSCYSEDNASKSVSEVGSKTSHCSPAEDIKECNNSQGSARSSPYSPANQESDRTPVYSPIEDIQECNNSQSSSRTSPYSSADIQECINTRGLDGTPNYSPMQDILECNNSQGSSRPSSQISRPNSILHRGERSSPDGQTDPNGGKQSLDWDKVDPQLASICGLPPPGPCAASRKRSPSVQDFSQSEPRAAPGSTQVARHVHSGSHDLYNHSDVDDDVDESDDDDAQRDVVSGTNDESQVEKDTADEMEEADDDMDDGYDDDEEEEEEDGYSADDDNE